MKAFDITNLVRPNIRSLQPYRSARDEFRGKASLYLDANENPFPSVYQRYPDARQQRLRKEVAELKGTSPTQTLVTHGSDEAIDLLIRAFCQPRIDNIITLPPTYGMYATFASINDVAVREAALTPEFALDPRAVLKASDSSSRIVFLCSPNNPSGNLLRSEKIRDLLRSFPGIVVIDEAYIDFAGTASWTKSLNQFPNLVVLQTFSKAWGLAGIRAGLCFAHPEIIQVLEKIKPPYNVSYAAEKTILHAMSRQHRRMNRLSEVIRTERALLVKALQDVRFVRKVYPSDANFLLVRVDDAEFIYEALLRKGIVVRLRSGALHCDNCLRITIGTPAQNKKLIRVLNSL